MHKHNAVAQEEDLSTYQKVRMLKCPWGKTLNPTLPQMHPLLCEYVMFVYFYSCTSGSLL